MGILPKAAEIAGGRIMFNDPTKPGEPVDIAALDPNRPEMRAIRGDRISIIFQEPMTSLSPLHTVGDQISEALHLHRQCSKPEGQELTREMLRLVGRASNLSIRAFRRVATARHDRDGADLPARAADRG